MHILLALYKCSKLYCIVSPVHMVYNSLFSNNYFKKKGFIFLVVVILIKLHKNLFWYYIFQISMRPKKSPKEIKKEFKKCMLDSSNKLFLENCLFNNTKSKSLIKISVSMEH